MNSCKIQYDVCNLVYDAKAGVGEGALWDATTQRLYWIDVTGKKLYKYTPANKEMHSYEMPKMISTVVVIDSVNLLVALEDGIYEFNLQTKNLQAKQIPAIDSSKVRFNDGKCSPDGKLWVGTMDLGVTNPVASLYSVSKDYSIKEELTGITVSNGITWSPDGTKMYYVDSPTYTIVSFDYDKKTAKISNKKIIATTPKLWGSPDGNCIDADGMLWVAHWGGGIVSRWNTTTGELMDSIKVPAPNVTSVAFGGEKKDILFITTARNWMKPGEEEKYPQAGGLFSVKPNVTGVDSYKFKR
jgi:sugar lactone lactonase YvrE